MSKTSDQIKYDKGEMEKDIKAVIQKFLDSNSNCIVTVTARTIPEGTESRMEPGIYVTSRVYID